MKEIELLNLELTDEQKKKILKNSKTYATMELLCQRILNGDFCYRSLNMIDSLFRMYSATLQKELDPRELLYQEFKKFYDACGEQSLDFPDRAGVVWNKGIVSATGYGDGGYSGYGSKDENGDYVSFQIYYL